MVIVDAMYVRVRENRSVVSKGVLIAIGVNQDGYREVLGFEVANKESEIAWGEFFKHLKARGLREVDQVTSDDHSGLYNAIKDHFAGARWQRCQTHFSKNMLDKTPKKQRPKMKEALADMYDARDVDEAERRKGKILEQFAETASKAVDLLDEHFDDIKAVYSLPHEYIQRLRTSNSIERLNEEIRRRERVIRIFPNEGSVVRLIGALLIEHHEKWISGRKYFNMESYYENRATSEPSETDQTELSQAVSASTYRVA